MKSIKIKLFISLAAALTVSCSDMLNVAPDGRLTYDDIFGDNVNTSAYLNTCYDYIGDHGVSYYFWNRMAVWTDEAWDAEYNQGVSAASKLYNGVASASNHPILNSPLLDGDKRMDGDFWNSYWAAIRKCTFFLMNIDTANVTEETDRARWKAEAHLLRAYYYSELLRWFGCGLPILRDKVYDWNTDYSTVTRGSYYDVVKFIIEDCDAAIGTDALPWRITAVAEAGRVNKAMAWAIKSRMILYAASELYNEGENRWEEAYEITEAARTALAENGFALYDAMRHSNDFLVPNACFPEPNSEFAARYNEYFCYDVEFTASPVDRETIFQKVPVGTGGKWYGNLWDVDGVGAKYYKVGTCPSQELVDCYETTDGKPILNLANPYLDEKHTRPNYNADNTLYDPENPYANRDPRFYASIYYNGSKRHTNWTFDESQGAVDYPANAGIRTRTISTYSGDLWTGIHPSTTARTRTGYYHRKYLHPNCDVNFSMVQACAEKLFRYGEILLNFAEAAAETGDPAKMAEAVAAVNEVRARVNMPSLPAGLNQNELRLRIRNERRVELAFEEHRYFDVRRWTAPDADLSKTDKWITAMEITREENNSFTYVRRPVREDERACYTNRYLKLPIPLRDVNIILQQQGENWQNPGW